MCAGRLLERGRVGILGDGQMINFKLYKSSMNMVGTPYDVRNLPKVKMNMGNLAKYAREHNKTFNEFSDEEKALFVKK